MNRVPDFDPDVMSAHQRRVFDAVAAGPRGGVRGPIQVWLHNPGLAEHAQALGAYCRYGSSLPPRLSELAILLTAVHWKAGYEWRAHAPMAIAGGLPEHVVESIRTGRPPEYAQDDERAVEAFALELLHRHAVSPATWEQAQAALGLNGVIDLVGILGYYGLISMTIKSFEIGVPPPDDETFAITKTAKE